jgi:enediyne biosynthesis protein E5
MSTPLPPNADVKPAAPPKIKRRLPIDDRYLAPILITCILAVGHLEFGILELYPIPAAVSQYTFGLLESYSPTFIAIIASILMELVLGRLVTGKLPHLASAYISGISVGIIVRGPNLWPYILCSVIAIVSKYAIRLRGRHIWNPSNFSISVLIFLAPAAVTTLAFQVSNQIWPILLIWLLGSLILYRLGRLHITVTYVAAFLVLSFVRSAITGHSWWAEVGPLTGAVYQLFIFFMITDPKTTTLTKFRQCVVAVLVAVVETEFRLAGDTGVQSYLAGVFGPGFARLFGMLGELGVHAPYYALFVVGPISNLIEIIFLPAPKRFKPVPVTLPPSGAPTIGLQSGESKPAADTRLTGERRQ